MVHKILRMLRIFLFATLSAKQATGQNLNESIKIVLHTSSGALIGIDGNMSTTNLMRPTVTLGSHVVTVTYGDSFSKEYPITVTATETNFDFPIDGQLSLSGIPSEGKVFVDGVEQKQTPMKLSLLGVHNLRVRGDYGYFYDYSERVGIQPLEEKVLDVTLQKRPPRTYGMLLLNYGPIAGTSCFGLTVAVVQRWGFYLRGLSSFDEVRGHSLELDQLRQGPGYFIKDKDEFNSVAFGPIFRVNKNIYFYFGGGYCDYTRELKISENSKSRKNGIDDVISPYSSKGVMGDLGIIFKWKALIAQAGYNRCFGEGDPKPYGGFYLGLGLTIHKQRKD